LSPKDLRNGVNGAAGGGGYSGRYEDLHKINRIKE